MSKQDRQGVRTPSDIERKYNFGLLDNSGQSLGRYTEQVNRLAQTLAQYMATTNATLEELEGGAAAWFSSGAPSLNNYPAADWTDTDTRTKHIGDMYYNNDNGDLYLFRHNGGDSFEWAKCRGGTSISNSYTVSFYDGNAEPMAVYTIRAGEAIAAPPECEDVAHWIDVAGNQIAFPYTPTGDINIYAY